jgi:hypothetical protein
MLRRAPSALTRASMINAGRPGIDSEYPKKECILVTRISERLRGGQNPVLPYLCAFAALREFILRSLLCLLFKEWPERNPRKFEG